MDNADVSGVTDEFVAAKVNDQPLKTQAEMDEIVGRERFNEREKVRREMEAKHKLEIEKLRAEQMQAASSQSQAGGVDTDAIRNQVIQDLTERAEAQQAEAEAAAKDAEMKRVADTYFDKMKTGGNKISDFDEIMGDFDHKQFPHLVWATSNMDNAAEVMYELANNPTKLEKINGWLKYSPERGLKELRNLSDSIRDTNAAIEEYQPTNAPLSQTKPSNVSAGNGMSKLEQMKADRKFMF